jgi:hypothetical protein
LGEGQGEGIKSLIIKGVKDRTGSLLIKIFPSPLGEGQGEGDKIPLAI